MQHVAISPAPQAPVQPGLTRSIHLPFGISLNLTQTPGACAGIVTSDLAEHLADEYADAVESLVLALACAGVDVQSAQFLEGLTTAVYAMGQESW